jgi:hypothetical protein
MWVFAKGGFTAELSALLFDPAVGEAGVSFQPFGPVKVSTQWVLYRFLGLVSTRFGHQGCLTFRWFSTNGNDFYSALCREVGRAVARFSPAVRARDQGEGGGWFCYLRRRGFAAAGGGAVPSTGAPMVSRREERSGRTGRMLAAKLSPA